MHVITHRRLREFWAVHPPSQVPLAVWYKLMKKAELRSFAELRRVFPNADRVKGKLVFNIGGNKYRLIAAIHFNRKIVFIRHMLTHAEYDRGNWK